MSYRTEADVCRCIEEHVLPALPVDLIPASDGAIDLGSATKMFKDGYFAGDVGIGISPAEKFHIRKDQSGDTTLRVQNADAGIAASANISVNNGTTWDAGMRMMALGTGYATGGGFVQDCGVLSAEGLLSGGLSIMVRANAPMRFYTNGSTNERMRITEAGYIMLGNGAPNIRMIKLTGTTGASEGDTTQIVHGLADRSKIIGAQVLVSSSTGNRIPPNFKSVNEHEFDFFIDTTNVHIYLAATNSGSITNGAITVLITYEE